MHRSMPVLAMTCLALLCLLPLPAQAHRVNVFASIQQGEVVVEGSFARGRPAQKVVVEAFLPEDPSPVFRGDTNEAGMARFPLPDSARGKGLRIVLSAGEGHRNEWTFSATDLPDATAAAAATTVPPAAAPAITETRSTLPAATTSHPTPQLEALVAEAVRRELAPVQQQLAELQRLQTQPEPDARDIIAGIGFLFGLAGVAMLVKGKR